MHDRGLIFGALAVFVGLVTSPIWIDVAGGTRPAPPELKRPVGEKHCVAPVEYMRTSHMELLTAWREEVVRSGERKFVSYDGRTYDKSLTQTCLQCHGAKADFCDRCHDYAGVKPYCWECHTDKAGQGTRA